MSKIISVRYKNTKSSDGFGKREYSYYSNLDVKPGDMVFAPSAMGENIVMVSEIDIPDSRVDERVLPLLKNITRKYEPEQEAPICQPQ